MDWYWISTVTIVSAVTFAWVTDGLVTVALTALMFIGAVVVEWIYE